jgi:cytochrome c-type biogenesis protein CcmE
MARKKVKFALLGVAVALAIGLLTYSALGRSYSYSLSVSELLAKGEEMVEKPVRVNGIVEKGSINYSARRMELRFTIVDKKNRRQSIPVIYNNVAPDTFGSGVEVVVDGKLSSEGVFKAKSVLTRCASKYQSEKR